MAKDLVRTIEEIKNAGGYKKYIEYIVFPFYKNLIPNARINFEFPLTVLVGKNGSGKSSTLHALFGAPLGKTCGDFWFSTEVDPIAESGARNRYFYGYSENGNGDIKEVMKTRMKRGSRTKKEDPDYWETSRPILKDGMKKDARHKPVEKDVIYLDFRAEVSAFDKVFHFSREDLEYRKNLLRKRSKYLKRLFEGEAMRFPRMEDEKVGKVEFLEEGVIERINDILGKDYTSIRVAEHRIFRNWGTSIYVQTKTSTGYSEANAGSGEIAIIQLVRRIQAAKDYTLVLLDEPEVSVHPGAQEKLKFYLLEMIKRKKLQVIISSHSPALIKDLPNSALKLFKTNEEGKFYIVEDISYQEAFYDIEDFVSDKKLIFCEDYAAKCLIDKVLKSIDKLCYFEVAYYSGGEKTLVGHYMVPITLNDRLKGQVSLMLDGDMRSDYVFNEELLTKQQLEDSEYLLKCVKKAYGVEIQAFTDSGDSAQKNIQQCEIYLNYLRYYNSNVFFLPGNKIPEEIMLSSEYVKANYENIIEKYGVIDKDNAKAALDDISYEDHGDYDHRDDTISKLAYKWSIEESRLKTELVQSLETIFSK